MTPPVIKPITSTSFSSYGTGFANQGYLGNNTKYTPSLWTLPFEAQRTCKKFFLVDYKQKKLFEFDTDTCLHMFLDGKAAQEQLHKL